MMLRPLWTWQRWMAAATPKVFRIALLSARTAAAVSDRAPWRGDCRSRPGRRPCSPSPPRPRPCLSPLPSTPHQDMVADMQTVARVPRDPRRQRAPGNGRLRGAVATRFRQVRADGPRGGTCGSTRSAPSGFQRLSLCRRGSRSRYVSCPSDNLDGPHGGDVGPRTRSWRPPPSSRPRPRPRPEDKTDPLRWTASIASASGGIGMMLSGGWNYFISHGVVLPFGFAAPGA